MLVYVITNLINGKQYVGQTVVSVESRWRRHCWPCNKMVISVAIRKHGKENFRIEEVERCETLEALNEAEKRWALKLNSFSPNGYNLKAGNGLGAMSEETKLKISRSNTGKRWTDGQRANLSRVHLGQVVSEETRKKLSAARRGKRLPDAAYINAAKTICKTYELTSPDGSKVRVTNMNDHCRRHRLSPGKMCLVVQGKRKHHKGWTGTYVR